MKTTLTPQCLTIQIITPIQAYAALLKFNVMKNIQSYINEKRITLNDAPLVKDMPCVQGDVLKVWFKPEEIDVALDEKPATIVWQDDLLCIVDKPAGIIVHEDDKQKTGTLASRVAKSYALEQQAHAVRFLHRLDKETRGLVVFSKIQFLQPLLDKMLSEKQIKRFYLAKVEGALSQKQTIHKPIGKDRNHNQKQRISHKGKPAVTHVTPLMVGKKSSWVECELETGRTHQIRVHLSSIGHPILNDALYGTVGKGAMQLFAYKIEMMHPITQEKIIIKLPIEKSAVK